MVSVLFMSSASGWEILPKPSNVCSCRKCSCPCVFPPGLVQCDRHTVLSWLPWLQTPCAQRSLPTPSLQHISRSSGLRRGACVSSASPPRFTVSHSRHYSHFCECTGIFLVYGTNKIILSLILTLLVLQPARTGHSW